MATESVRSGARGDRGRGSWQGADATLAALLPFVYTVWADGMPTRTDLDAIRAVARSHTGAGDADMERILTWLDPDAPPSPTELLELQGLIRSAPLPDPAAAARSLTDLGLALATASGGGAVGPSASAETVEQLRGLESALGVLGPEAARRALGVVSPASAPPRGGSGGPAESLGAYLDRDHLALRNEVLGLLSDPALRPPLGLPYQEYRDRVLGALRLLAERRLGSLAYPEQQEGRSDPGGAIAVFETLAFGDLSVLVKFGVQFGLFGGSILQLGTRRHHERYLGPIARLELPGCYAMSETGHGSNVRDLETTATYEADTDELVVHTPHEGAAKDWIGNAALHGRLATVFARLLVRGEDHGVHAVLVAVRGQAGEALPGVRIEDRGLKQGLNGVDNGRIWFDRVRVPRENLLDRFGSIDDAGCYHSPIPSSGRRFFRMLGTLVAGRVSIAAAAVSATKVGLTIAIRYGSERRQFGPAGEPEQPILDYPSLQLALMPRLATTYGLHFATRKLQRRYATSGGGEEDPELEVEAAGLKAYASEHCVAALQACREACGGQGYLAENRLAALKADTDVFTTFEGANPVLYQLVAKGLLSRYRDEMSDLSLGRMMRYVLERAETTLVELNPVLKRRTDPEHLLDPEVHLATLTYREERLLRSAGSRLRARLEGGMDSFRAVAECQDHLITLARAHVERVVLLGLQEGALRAPGPGLADSLRSLAALYALERVDADRGWFLQAGTMEAAKTRAIRAMVTRLCKEVRDQVDLLVDAFGLPDSVLPEVAWRAAPPRREKRG